MLPFSKGRTVVSFSFSQGAVRIACAKISSGAKAEIIGVKNCNIEGLTDEAAAAVIKKAVKEFNVSRPVFVSSIDSPSVITKNIEIPSIKETEIKEIIDLQAGRYTPYGRGEIIVDYVNIGTYHSSYTKVLIVIIVKEIIKKQLSIFEKSGFVINKVQFSSEGIGCVCSKALALGEKAAPSIILSVDNKVSDFIVLFKGKTIFIRTIPIGYDTFVLDKIECETKFVDEVKKSLDAYRAEDIEEVPDEFILIGPPDMTDAVKMKVSKILGMPTRNFLFYSGMLLSKEMLSDNTQLAFVNTIAAVLSSGETIVDLRPPDLKLKAFFQERSREIIKSGILLMAIIIMACVILLGKIYYRGGYLSKLDTQLKIMEPQIASLEKTSNKIAIIRGFIENKKRPLDIISELYELVPEDAYLKSVVIDEKGEINIKGTAGAMSEVFGFVSDIEGSKYFKGASAQNTASRKEGGKDVSDFEITCKLRVKGESKEPDKAGSNPENKNIFKSGENPKTSEAVK